MNKSTNADQNTTKNDEQLKQPNKFTYFVSIFSSEDGKTKFQKMSCMLKLNATVWQQKLNIEDIGG